MLVQINTGSKYLNVNPGAMKNREESEKLLTKRAKQALETAYKKPGLLFGPHDYRLVVAEAAAKAFPPQKARRFTTAHLRSAELTHMADSGASLAAIQSMADHKLSSTTDRYIRSSKKALEQELRRQGRL
jgi:site-specific recombinase XerD